MKQKLYLVASITLAGFVGLLAGCGQQQEAESTQTAADTDKGTIRLAYVNWAEGVAVTHLVTVLLEDMGYEVEATMADVAPIYTSVAEGNQDIMVETWLPHTHEAYYKEYGDQVELISTWFENARIGLVVPDYVTIESIEDLNGARGKFDGQITGIDSGAGIMRATETALDAYDLDYELLASSGAAMTAALQSAIEKEEWIVVTGWSPHWKFARYDLKYLEDPKETYGATEKIHSAARLGFADEYPEVAALFGNMKFDAVQIGSLMDAMQGVQDGQEEATVRAWIADNSALIDSWMP